MNNPVRRRWFFIISIFVIASVWASHELLKKKNHHDFTATSKLEGNSYWTCPMHPQIHMTHPGECPICHMKLVQVVAESQAQAKADQGTKRSGVQVSAEQYEILGIQKYQLQKMDLKADIPVSGRMLSSSSVAFQVYEDDLRYIRPGLSFKGASGAYPEDEITGVISSVDSIIDPTSRTVRVVGSFRQGGRSQRAETSFRGEIQLELKDRLAIPESAVLHTGNGDLVYLFAIGSKLQPQTVKLGMKAEGYYEVIEGVALGDAISSGPNFLIDSEAKIRAAGDSSEKKAPECPSGQYWDIPMAMCMPGKASQ